MGFYLQENKPKKDKQKQFYYKVQEEDMTKNILINKTKRTVKRQTKNILLNKNEMNAENHQLFL